MSATTISTAQIRDGAITNAKVAAGAAIATSKLADSANFIFKDGSVAFTGNVDAGNNKVVNVTTPSSSSDAATKGYVDTQISSVTSLFTSKGTVRVATTANGTLATAFANGQTVDGVTLATGDRILLKNQSSQAENGIRIVQASGAPTRSEDMNSWDEVPGAWVSVQEGTTNADTTWLCTANQGGTLDTTAITWTNPITSGAYSNSNFVDKEVPSGSINGSNTAYTLANTPTSGSEHVYLNGVLLESGSGNDYTISSGTITMATAPVSGDKLLVSYRK